MFLSQYEHVLDSKGRTSIPAKFREILAEKYDDRLILTTEQDGCIVVRPYLTWTELLSRVRSQPRTSQAVRAFERLVLGQAQEVALDKQGRILLPPALRQKAGLDKKVYFVGLDDKFEIWDPAAWDEQVAESEAFLEGHPDELSKLGI